jgi:hypothetical protein
MLMPAAPFNALPFRFTAPLLLVLRVELFAAMEPPPFEMSL